MSSSPRVDLDCLVAVVNNDGDLERFAREHWYRIPERMLGRALSAGALREARVLALYQTTKVRAGLPSAVELWGRIEEVDRMTRREILPEEPDHPSASEPYHILRVSSVDRLERPIVRCRGRRVNFIRTTSERLFHAVDVNDLVVGSAAEERLWQELRGDNVERKYVMEVSDVLMEVDFALFRGHRALGILVGEDEGAVELPGNGMDLWSILRFSPHRLEADLTGCLQEIMAMVRQMER